MKTRKDALDYGLSFPDTYKDTPFRDENWVLVRYKGNKKAFLWTYERNGFMNLNVKADPETIYFWRSAYKSVVPGYHQNKSHWNTIILDESIPDVDLKQMIAQSYALVSQNPTKQIYEAVKRIPYGKVATYSQIARLAGNSKMSRAVGNALHKNPDPENIPCFRVVDAKGELAGAFAFGGVDAQAKRLKEEGVQVDGGKVDLTKYQWDDAASNPWESICLSDYEKHMSLENVYQLQTLNQLMKRQLEDYKLSSVMILGVAGGNGLEHIRKDKYVKVYGVDINEQYLKAVRDRYTSLSGVLECIPLDLTIEYDRLPSAELVIADLLIEYVSYEAFTRAVNHIAPKVISCVIQINEDEEEWVSDSPYLHVFDCLEEVHSQINEDKLIQCMEKDGYRIIKTERESLPNGKGLERIDFAKGDCPLW